MKFSMVSFISAFLVLACNNTIESNYAAAAETNAIRALRGSQPEVENTMTTGLEEQASNNPGNLNSRRDLQVAFDLVNNINVGNTIIGIRAPQGGFNGNAPYMRPAEEEWFVLEHNGDLEFRTPTPNDPASPASRIKFLRFQPGYVTTAQITNQMTVLSGKFSGCWMTTYTLGGNQYVAHIGTCDDNSAINDRAKTAWNTFVTTQNPTNVRGFNPSRDFPGNRMGADLYGMVAPNGNFYTLEVNPDAADVSKNNIKSLHLIGNTLPPSGQIA